MSALLPCPFCGSRDIAPAHKLCDYAECNVCGAYGPPAPLGRPERTSESAAKANAAWNRRTPPEGTIPDATAKPQNLTLASDVHADAALPTVEAAQDAEPVQGATAQPDAAGQPKLSHAEEWGWRKRNTAPPKPEQP
jgi:Lar family restriction alleviation protein